MCLYRIFCSDSNTNQHFATPPIGHRYNRDFHNCRMVQYSVVMFTHHALTTTVNVREYIPNLRGLFRERIT